MAFVQVLPVIVAQVVVAHNGTKLDSTPSEEVCHHGFESRLSGFEISTSDARLLLLSQFHDSGVQCVLRTAVEVSHTLHQSGVSIQHRGLKRCVFSDKSVHLLKVLNRLDSLLGIGGPQNDDLVYFLLELLDILS